jgi:hypothetical protein
VGNQPDGYQSSLAIRERLANLGNADDRDLLAALEAARKSPGASPEATVKPLKEKG